MGNYAQRNESSMIFIIAANFPRREVRCMLNLHNIYNYYSSQIPAPRSSSRANSHKKDDLKTVYNNMVRQNQNSPFYKFAFPDSSQVYAIGIKEAAMALESKSSSLSNPLDGTFEQVTVTSDNENLVYASLNNNDTGGLPNHLAIQVDELATGQTNVGSYLPSGETSFAPGSYSFGIAVGSNQYTFNLNVNEGDTNRQIQQNLASSINENNIGVQASIRNNRVEGTSALVLRSDTIGLPKDDELFFRFDETYLENDITTRLGIHHVDTAPKNATFHINGDLHTSISNRISLNQAMDIDLLSVTEKPVNIRLVPDVEQTTDMVKDFIDSYNQLVDIARNGTNEKGATKLFRDVTGIANKHQTQLENAGITIDDKGYLNQTGEVDNENIRDLFDEDSSFRKDIKRMTEKMTLNPLNYIDKTVVTYPNTSGTYPNPYHPSKYSGLLFNDYA